MLTTAIAWAGSALVASQAAQLESAQPMPMMPGLVAVDVPHIQYFGFVLVDCGFDDPLDGVPKTNYLDEVAPFTNIAHLAVFAPTDNITTRLDAMAAARVKPLLHVQEILFTTNLAGRVALRPDYTARWNAFVTLNNLAGRAGQLACVYPVDEPAWNGLSAAGLKAACDLIDAGLPDTPILIIEAPPAVAQLKIPTSADWIGFDSYGVLDPGADAEYQSLLSTLRSRRSRLTQKIAIIMDTQWLPIYGEFGVQPIDMGAVAVNYAVMAQRNKDVTAVIGYLWPGGFDEPGQLGARELPGEVIDIYRAIGAWITGK